MNPQPDQDPAAAAPTPLAPDWNYEATVAKIEAIIAQIEAGELDLAEVFEQFSHAMESLQQCEQFLNQRQQQMDLLIEKLDHPADV